MHACRSIDGPTQLMQPEGLAPPPALPRWRAACCEGCS